MTLKGKLSPQHRPPKRISADRLEGMWMPRGVLDKSIAERALAKGISSVVFDRGGYLYHGRIKALTDAAREAGLNKGEAVREEEAPEAAEAPVEEKPRKKSKEKQ